MGLMSEAAARIGQRFSGPPNRAVIGRYQTVTASEWDCRANPCRSRRHHAAVTSVRRVKSLLIGRSIPLWLEYYLMYKPLHRRFRCRSRRSGLPLH